jgi:hypothetical protein
MLRRVVPVKVGALAIAMVLPHFTPRVLLEPMDREPTLRVPAESDEELGE